MKKNILSLFFLFGILCNSQEKKLDSKLVELDSLFTQKKYEKVIALGQNLLKNNTLKKDSISAKVNLNIGQAYIEQLKLEDSEHYLKEAYKYKKKDSLYLNILKSLAEVNEKKDEYNLALKYLKEESDISKSLYDVYSNEILGVNNRTGVILMRMSNYRVAKTYFIKNLKITDSISVDKKEIIDLFINLSNCSNADGDYDEAIAYLNQSVTLEKEIYGQKNKKTIISYGNIALNYNAKGENDRAIDYQNKALELCKALINPTHSFFGTLYLNLGVYYNDNNEIKNAFLNYKKALTIYEKIYDNNHPLIGVVKNALGGYYEKKLDYEKSLSNYSEAINIWEETLGKNHEYLANGYYSRGDFHKNRGNYNLAIEDLKKCLLINQSIYGEHNDKVTASYLYLADTYILAKDYINAKTYLNLAQKFFSKEALNAVSYDDLDDKTILATFLSTRNNYLSALKKEDPIYIDSLISNYKNSLKLQDHIQKSYISNTSKEFQLKNNFYLYEEYIDLIYEQNKDLKLAFELSEKTKSRSLMERFNLIAPTNSNIIPKSLSKRETALNKEITYYKKQSYVLKQDSKPDLDSIKSIDNTIFELKRDQENLKSIFKKKYPKYHQLKYDYTVASLTKTQETLNKNQALIEYFTGEKNIYIFIITKDNFKVERIKKDFPLNEWVQQLRIGIYEYWSNSNAKTLKKYNDQYQETAFALYNKLIKPYTNLIPEELIIIPDADISLIPFDALLTDQTNPSSYLIKKHQISYNYSATNYVQILKEDRKKFKENLLAIAPSFNEKYDYTTISQRRNFEALKYNVEEAKIISDLFNGTLLENNMATKNIFLEKAQDYGIIHLSTHAKSNNINGEQSYIVFQNQTDSISNDNLLSASELYSLNLNTDMVVLSACETGIGEIQKGEGVIGLAQAFSYAGAKSTITSLWSVNDAQTSILMKLFYANIKKGIPKDKALRDAKLKYIINEDLIAPYFWAGFIPNGDMQPIKNNNTTTQYLIIITLIALLFLGYFIYRKYLK